MWPTCTRSKAPWQRTMVRSRNWFRTRASSASGTTFCRQLSVAGSTSFTGRIGEGPRLQHVPRVPDDNISLSGVTEELPERRPPPRVVAMDHDHVRERGCFDAAPVRPSETHVPLVLQQPHQWKTHRTRLDQGRAVVL